MGIKPLSKLNLLLTFRRTEKSEEQLKELISFIKNNKEEKEIRRQEKEGRELQRQQDKH